LVLPTALVSRPHHATTYDALIHARLLPFRSCPACAAPPPPIPPPPPQTRPMRMAIHDGGLSSCLRGGAAHAIDSEPDVPSLRASMANQASAQPGCALGLFAAQRVTPAPLGFHRLGPWRRYGVFFKCGWCLAASSELRPCEGVGIVQLWSRQGICR
jgi:hypothetical protein